MTGYPQLVAAGEALTDMLRTGPEGWTSQTGGSTWNVARVAARLGLRTAFAGAVSEDLFGRALLGASADAGLDMRFIQTVAKPPLLAIVHTLDPPSYFFIGDDSADLHFDSTRLPCEWQTHVECVHFGGISLAREPLASRLINVAVRAKASGALISYDPNFRTVMTPAYDRVLQRMTTLADVVKVSEDDLAGLFRHDDTDAAFDQLRRYNPRATYLLTRGAQGATLYRGHAEWRASPPPIQLADTVGAGDASIGALLFSLLQRVDDDAGHLRFAVAAGAAACQHSGATPPVLAAVERLYDRTAAYLQSDSS